MEVLILLVTTALSMIIAAFVLLNNPKSGTNFYFGLLVILIGLYPILNYLAVNAPSNDDAFFWAKAILLVSIPQGPLLYFFAKVYPSSSFIFSRRKQLAITFWFSANIFFALLSLIFIGVEIKDGSISIVPGPLVPSFGLLHISSIVAGIYILRKKYKQKSNTDSKRLFYVYYGILFSFTFTFLSTIILPLFLNNTLFLEASPLFLLLAVFLSAYSIISKGLFDIRAIVARSVAYLLLILSLSLLYGLLIISISTLFLQDEIISFKVIGLFAVAALAMGYTLQPLKTFFDKASNRIFFRDSYNPQVILNLLSEMLAKNIQLKPITTEGLKIISEAVRPTGSKLVVLSEGKSYLTESFGEHVNSDDLLPTLTSLNGQLINVSDMQDKHAGKLRKHDIEVVVRLQNESTTIGYLLLRAKKSGNIYTTQDLNLLTISANEMAIAIQNALHFDEIQKFNVTLQRKIELATAQLQHTNEKLKALDEAKDEFISMASHQLRTPLTSIKGYVSMVMDEDAGKINAQQRELLTSAFNSSQRMVYLIADLLNVSRLHTGKFVIEPGEVNLADVIESEIQQLEDTAKGHEIKLVYKKPKNIPSIILDETKTRQVIMNFIDNAIYYTPKGGTVTIKLASTAKEVLFTVTDNGIGVPKAEQKNLFTKFYRAGNARKARPDGTGLGLFMAKKVIVAQEGALIFTSKEGKGSTFGFTFPLSKVGIKKSKKSSSQPKE